MNFIITLNDLRPDKLNFIVKQSGFQNIYELENCLTKNGSKPFGLQLTVVKSKNPVSHQNDAPSLIDCSDDDIQSIETDEDIVEPTNVKKFDGFNVYPYGKGYQMVPPFTHKDIGKKYYHDGFWNPDFGHGYGAWFFKADKLSFLAEHGAVIHDENENQYVKKFSGFNLHPHGKGYQLIAPYGHKDEGKKYYHNGWWKPKLNAWFFKKEFIKYLIDNGAHLNEK